jgi:hypothetical protein
MRQPPPLVRAVAVGTLVVLAQALLVAMFAWPAVETAPRDLPVVVAGPPPAVAAIRQELPADAFSVSTVPDAAAADQALRDREAYAAFVIGPTGAQLHVASAASPIVAQLLIQRAQAAGTQVIDVVPLDADDPRGAGFASSFLPLILTGMIAGALLAFAIPGRRYRLVGLLTYAVLAGLVGAWLMQSAMGILPGSYLGVAGAIGLISLAIAASVTGLASALGVAGVPLAALLIFVVGNPLSGVSTAPELLPQPWGQVGQLIPPGAGATLLRSTAYFDGAGGVGAAWTLGAWAAVGLILVLIGRKAISSHGPAQPAPADREPALAAG